MSIDALVTLGPANVRARAEANTDPVELALYGDGQWPHFSAYQRGELASNGNYYETDAIAVRHGICGDPEQVTIQYLPPIVIPARVCHV